VTLVALATVTLVPAVPPNEAAVAPVRLVPVMVTVVPPVAGPVVGAIDEIDGAGGVAGV
jgi:hypothetical protein